MKKLWLAVFGLGVCPALANAAEGVAVDSSSLDADAIAVYATACEKIKDGEAKSSVRVRATDKAAFNAVETISLLKEIKDETNPHDFNVLVYNLVDNYLEDMNVRTTRQDGEQICVEVTGYIKDSYVLDAVNNAQNNDKLQIEAPVVVSEPATPAPSAPTALETPKETAESRALVYIAPVKFYNGASSAQHREILAEIFQNSKYVLLTEKSDLADYIITPEILRAKVDPINSNTNRLQMVVSVSGNFVEEDSSTTEHQNRFVLFASSDDAQKVAADLMQKLLSKAAEPILNKIEAKEHKKRSNSFFPEVITPAAPSMP